MKNAYTHEIWESYKSLSNASEQGSSSARQAYDAHLRFRTFRTLFLIAMDRILHVVWRKRGKNVGNLKRNPAFIVLSKV